MAADKCKNDDDTVSEKASGSVSAAVCVCVCVGVFVCLRVRICAKMGCAAWNTATVLAPSRPDSAMSWGALAGRYAWQARHFESVTALSYTPAMQRTCNTQTCNTQTCNTHATHMQHTCNTHATHMQHDMQHGLFTRKFTVNVQDLTFAAPTLVLEWKMTIFAPRPLCLDIYRENARVACVLHVCCMCVACVLHVCCMCAACALHVRGIGRPIQITPLNWGRKKKPWQAQDL